MLRDELLSALARADLDGRRVCVVVPDATRACPLAGLLSAVHDALAGRVASLTVLVALGTHPPMAPDALRSWLGADSLPGARLGQHAWWDPSALVTVGVVTAARIRELSGGLLDEDVPVRLNRAVVDHDVVIVLGPVLPHEVAGFSGGTKYLVPGVAAAEVIDVSHWLGALITSAAIIGTPGTTPVRALIDDAAALVPADVLACCVVTVGSGSGVCHLSVGEPGEAWAAAVRVAAQVHVRYLDRPVGRVVSVIPERYDDMWTAAKGFYKVEPVVADGGEVVLVAPHVTTFSAAHPEIERIGYHCRDWFLGQPQRMTGIPRGVVAHSTHLRGAGSWSPDAGERARVRVTLATGMPRERVEAAGLGWADPAALDWAGFAADPSTLVVPDAGEMLFRLGRSPG